MDLINRQSAVILLKLAIDDSWKSDFAVDVINKLPSVDVDRIFIEFSNLQTYKLSEGAEELLWGVDDVMQVLRKYLDAGVGSVECWRKFFEKWEDA